MSLPTLILIHGYPLDHTMWNFVSGLLRSKANVITPDLPGFGNTPVLSEEPSIERMADSIVEILYRKKIDEAIVAGMSMGGYVALAFAEKYPDKLAGLGLISTYCWADTDEARKGRRDMIEKVKKDGEGVALAAALPKLFSDKNVGNEVLTKFPTEGARKAGSEGICWALEAMARRPDRSSILQGLKSPVLVLHGTEDKFMPVTRAKEMAALSAEAEFVEVKGAGHATPLEAPGIVADALGRLVARMRVVS